MKRLLIIVLTLTFSLALFAEISIDRENCTFTKDGKIYPLQGKVVIVDSDSYYDIAVTVAPTGSYEQVMVELVNSGSSTQNCGQFEVVNSGSYHDLVITIVDSGSYHDLTVTLCQGFSGIK